MYKDWHYEVLLVFSFYSCGMCTFHLACHVNVKLLIQIYTNKVDAVESLKSRETNMKARKMKICFPIAVYRM